MSESVINLEKVGKRYRIGKERYHSLREDLTHLFHNKVEQARPLHFVYVVAKLALLILSYTGTR